MRSSVRFTALNAALVLTCAVPAAAQTPTIITDLVGDVSEVEKKLVDLAKAIPADKFDWRPGQGVRSVGEVVKHVASDNYLIPALLGTPADASTGITTDYKTAQAYEARKMTKDQAIAEMQKSFAHLKKTMNATPAAKLNGSVSFFGTPSTMQKAWVGTTTHLHEHLGQLIAYARTNGVKPPWS
jgi:uncharacterized damage-inducible protein DinB